MNASPTSNATQTNGNCVKGDRCLYMHKWFSGEGFSMLSLVLHFLKDLTSFLLPTGTEQLEFGIAILVSMTVLVNLRGEAGYLVSNGPWIFIGVLNLAWNIESNAEFNLDGPHGQVHAIVGHQ
ncbi:unnamed protein product [Malus baccata var. baccata]